MTWATLHADLHASGLVRSEATPAQAGIHVTGVAYDSRTVEPGAVFVALKGQHSDGAAFIREAVAKGAAVIVSDHAVLEDARVPCIVVDDARVALARLAAAFFGHPSTQMQVVGITGTNGKTTTAFIVSSIFEAAGIQTGMLGTVTYRIGGELRDATRTTPEAPDVQRLLREMVDRGCGACAMEVSSHALALRRVDGMAFSAAVFTNLTRDHLDFHPSMEDYFQAKRRLFDMMPPGRPSVVNVDDPRGVVLADSLKGPVTFAINRRADITPGALAFSLSGLSFDVRTPRGTLHVQSKLVGRPNVYNILAAVATAVALDVPFDAIEQGVQKLAGVPGRFQVVSSAEDGVTVIVDYAHTDDALRNLLETARPLTGGRLITVFGCGGDRDRTKRPLMGMVAGRLSDLVIVTSDNPRSEDPNRIIEEILRGITVDTRKDGAQKPLSIPDRMKAIEKAVDLARTGDVVLIAGKGHEKYQVIGSRTLPFDDVAVAGDALAKRRTNSGVR